MTENPDPLITAAWLKERLGAPDLRIIDASWFLNEPRDPRAEHVLQRIPGAVFFDIEEIADTDSPLPHMLPSPEKFSSRMRKLGVGDGAQIVVYDSKGLFSAPRVWWTFRVMGHEDVSVLDGGLPAWIEAGGELEDGPPAPRSERHFTARFHADLVRNLAEMRRAVETHAPQVVDARARGRLEGRDPEPRPGLRGGRMPGAYGVPYGELLRPDGRMKSKAELTAIFTGAGVDLRKPIVTSCGSGVSAAVLALALARLGRWDVPIYDGSWAEWGARDDTPIVTGPL